MSEYLLEMKNICKSFPGVKALQGVNFQLKSGEIKVFHGAITDNTGVVHGTEGEDLPYDEIRSMNWLVDFMAGTV